MRNLFLLSCTVLLVAVPVTEVNAEPMPDDLSDRIVSLEDASDRQIRALARNHLDVVEMMVTSYLLRNKEQGMPEDFSEIATSVAWTIEVFNIHSGEPISFSSQTQDPVTGGIRPDFAQSQEENDGSDGGGGAQRDRRMQRPQFNAASVEQIPINEGNLFYKTEAGSLTYQLAIKWGEKPTQVVNRPHLRPYNFYAGQKPELDNPVTPEDRSLFLVAQFLENQLPELERRFAYFFDAEPPPDGEDAGSRSFSTLMERAATIGLQPYNPFNNELLTTSESYREGFIYTGPLASQHPDEIFYCFSNGRIRSFNELTDPAVQRRRREELARRDRRVQGIPAPDSSEQRDPPPEEDGGSGSGDRPWRN